ncbi:PqqD family protein [Chloroflexota bacterium]
MESSARPLINPAVIQRQIYDGEAVLVNMDTAGAVALNATGVVVWQLLDGQRSVEEVIAAVQHHFQDVPEDAAGDVVALLDILAEEAFIGFEWTPTAPI